MHAVERGKEIAAYDLYAFGGAAPMHVCTLAERLGVETVVVPPGAGVRSCFGFLASPLAFDVARSHGVRLEEVDLDAIGAILEGLEAEARAPLALAGVTGSAVTVRRFVEMRYRGQGYEVEVPAPAGRVERAWLAALVAAFEDVYRAYYRHVPSGLPMEAVTWRVRAQSPAPSLPPPRAPRGAAPSPERRATGVDPGRERVPQCARVGSLRAPARLAHARPRGHRGSRIHHRRHAGLRRDRRRGTQPRRHARRCERRRRPAGEAGMKTRASDPVFVEVAWSRLISVVEQEAQALLRTAFTNIVRESGDLSAGVFDLQGRMVAQAITGTPGHINSMALAVRHVLRRAAPGDARARRRAGHQRPVAGLRSPQRHHRGDACLPPRAARRLHRQHLPRHGHRRPRHHGGRARLLRGGLPAAALSAVRGRSPPASARAARRQRARPRGRDGRPACPGQRQRRRRPPPGRNARGVRPRRHRGPRRRHPGPQRGGHARGHRRDSRRRVSLRALPRRLRGARRHPHPRGGPGRRRSPSTTRAPHRPRSAPSTWC